MDIGRIVDSIASDKGISLDEVRSSNVDKLFCNYSGEEPNYVSSLHELLEYVNNKLPNNYSIDIEETPARPVVYKDASWRLVLTKYILNNTDRSGETSISEKHTIDAEVFELYADALPPDDNDPEIPRQLGNILDKIKTVYDAIEKYESAT
tara:strand:- start:33539 stop:33991 length:453 start_codon:yes stop_codon:yes gene_type:complete